MIGNKIRKYLLSEKLNKDDDKAAFKTATNIFYEVRQVVENDAEEFSPQRNAQDEFKKVVSKHLKAMIDYEFS